MTEGVPNLKIATLNISWEANNAVKRSRGSGYDVLGPKLTSTNTGNARAFSRAHTLWVEDRAQKYNRGDYFGAPYEESIRLIGESDLDVVLLQEFQMYTHNSINRSTGAPTSSIEVLVDSKHLENFTVVATNQIGGGRFTACASVVLVRTDLISTGSTPLDRSAEADWSSRRAFDTTDRPVAIADVVLERGGQKGNYRIVSSHSAHGIDWTNVARVKRYIAALQGLGGPVPLSFIWGGDFNSALSVGKDGDTNPYPAKWMGRPVRKVARSAMPKNTTEFGSKIDWIMATSTTGGNPTEIEITESGSDHRLVQITTQGHVWDWTI